MPSWWGKSSSKDVKKKTTKENFIDTLHRFLSPAEHKGNVRSPGARRRGIDTTSERGSLSRAESRSPPPSNQVSRCESFADRPHAQPLPLPLPGLQSGITRTSSGISVSKPLLEKRGKHQLLLPLPTPDRVPRRPDTTDIDGDMATASVSSNCSIDSDDQSDSRLHSPVGNEFDISTRAAANHNFSESGEMCAMKEVTLFSDDAKSKESAKQLGQEICLLSRLRHQNIVQYYGCDTIDDKLYIYLEYVSGGSIHKLLQEYGQFGEPAMRSYTQQILSGLAYLHAKNTVHRDIKGANILVDPNGRVKLADFGMAKHITGKSCPLSFKGSPYWMAPEVIKNTNGCNLAVDIWSLGCTVLEMATSKPPWSQYEGIAAMFKIGNSKELPAIPDHLSDDGKDFIRQCLQREPSKRPTAAELLQHPFVRNAAPLEKSALGFEILEQSMTASSGRCTKGVGHAKNLSSLDMEGLKVHRQRGSQFSTLYSDNNTRNISCPVSPIGSPLLSSRSPRHANGRMSPSPISSPKATSGSSTPLTGCNGAIPFNQSKRFPYRHEGLTNVQRSASDLYASTPTYNDLGVDLFQGMQQGSPVFREQLASADDVLSLQFGRRPHADLHEQYDRKAILADHIPHQFLQDQLKLSPRLDRSPRSPIFGHTNGANQHSYS